MINVISVLYLDFFKGFSSITSNWDYNKLLHRIKSLQRTKYNVFLINQKSNLKR